MAFRSPTPDGLATGPNAAGNANNPAAQPQELQGHRFWGRYAAAADLPNAGANAAAAPAYTKMAPGDVAFVQADGGLYLLQDRGTVSGGDAVWVSLAGGGAGTVRDAHVFVVGISGALAPIGAQASPPNPSNNANLAVGGDVAGVTCDYLDPGDGSQLELALLAAGAIASFGVDIRIRPGAISLDPGAVSLPLIVPNYCILSGAGPRRTVIASSDGAGGATQEVLQLGLASTLEEMTVTSGSPVATPGAGLSPALINCPIGSNTVRRCRINLLTISLFDRAQTIGLLDSGGGTLLVDECEFLGGNGWIQPGGEPVVAVRYGLGSPQTATTSGAVTGCRFSGWNRGVQWLNCAAGAICENCWFQQVFAPDSVLVFQTTQPTPGNYPGPIISNVRIQTEGFGGAIAPVASVGVAVTATGGAQVINTLIDDIHAWFLVQGQDPQACIGVLLSAQGDGSVLRGGSIRGLVMRDAGASGAIYSGVRLTAFSLGQDECFVADIRVAEVVARRSENVGSQVDSGGVVMRALENAEIRRCSVMNSSLGEALNAGVTISSQCIDTHVGFNHLTSIGTALNDNGTNTEAANNILV